MAGKHIMLQVFRTLCVLSFIECGVIVSGSYTGSCSYGEECIAMVRSRYPSQSATGVDLCQCYAASSTDPFDECEGETDESCLIARCMNTCAGLGAQCLPSPNSSDGGKACALQSISVQFTNPVSSSSSTSIIVSPSVTPVITATGPDHSIENPSQSVVGGDSVAITTVSPSPDSSGGNSSSTLSPACTTNEECGAVVRSRFPLQSSIGVGLCHCYAASSTDPFDECEGVEASCKIAKCTNSCSGLEAQCLPSSDSIGETKACTLQPISAQSTSPISFSSTIAGPTSAPVSIAPGPNLSTTSPSLPGANEDSSTAPITPATIAPSPNITSGNSSVTLSSISTFSTCTADDECTAKVRSRYPSQSSNGVDMCQCYGASSTDPFDECGGETDATCMIAKCTNTCAGLDAHCNGTKACDLRPILGGRVDSQTNSEAEEDDLLESAGMILTFSAPILVWLTSVLCVRYL